MNFKNSVVLDTSAILAYLFKERGMDVVEPYLTNSIINTVTATEITTKLIRHGMNDIHASDVLHSLPVQIKGYGLKVAEQAGALIRHTHDYGISLGDRACLAFAEDLQLPVLTSDKDWQKIQHFISIPIRLIR